MRIVAFPANDGDCLLIESDQQNRILVDGGRSTPFMEHTLPVLAALREQNPPVKLDAICVSHIDEDHLKGILKMLAIEVKWSIKDKHPPGDGFKNPREPRPCGFEEVWHNGFHEQIGFETDPDDPPDADDLVRVDDLINAMADLVTGTDLDADDVLRSYANLATSVPQALELTARLSEEQLNVPVNKRFGGKLITSAADPIDVGTLHITFIGPTTATLEGLQAAWLKEFKEKKGTIANTKERMAKDVADLAAGVVSLDDVRKRRADLAATLAFAGGDLGDRSQITAPNLASLMFVVEENGRRAIFTGDGAGQDVIGGLEDTDFLTGPNDSLHVDVLKVQHHGSSFNIDADFCKRITADHYVISGDSNHGNPDLPVLDVIVNSRNPQHADIAATQQAGDNFTVHMAMSADVVIGQRRDALDKIFDHLDALAASLPAGRMTINRFRPGQPVTISL